MKVSSISSYSPNVITNQNVKKGSYVDNRVLNPNIPEGDVVDFKAKSDVIENLIVKDLANYHHYLKDMGRFSSNLKKLGKNLSVYAVSENGLSSYTITNPTINSVIRISIDENLYENVKPGFILGKTGFFATLDVTEKNGKSYVVEVHENSEFNNKTGIRVVNETLDNTSFRGAKRPTTTVNAYYKSEKTIKSMQRFYKLIKESPVFKSIEKTAKPYYEKFHPYLLAGGFGSRLEALSFGRGDNKPSTATPIKGMDLMHFSLLNLYQANLLPESTDDVDFVIQDEANSAVGCVITTLGYKIQNNSDGVDLVKDGKSVLPKDKAVVILPSDNVIDIDLTEVLDSYNSKDNVGMMVVGVPDYRCYGGLIRANEKDEIKDFIYKPTIESLEENDEFLYSLNEKGEREYLIDSNGQKTALGNAFIYIINPEILDTVASIYKNKITNAYESLIWSKGGMDKNIPQEEYLKVIECLWDREIIPALVDMSNQGKLVGKDDKELSVYVHRAMNTYYSDVGECSSYITTMRNVAREDAYKNIPASIKKEARESVQGNVLFNTDAKEEFSKLLGDGYTSGNIVVIPND